MSIVADIHCHTIASTHAYSTILENATVAARKGMFALGITDHGPNMPGAPGKWYFRNLTAVPRKLCGVYIIRGVEANILNDKGDLDVDFKYEHARLDMVVASIHAFTFAKNTDENYRTRAYLNIAKNPKVNIIGHSGTAQFTYDYERVIPELKKHGKLVEMNNHAFIERRGCSENCVKIAKICKAYNAQVILSSDAHFCENIGEVNEVYQMLKDIDFPENLIVNSNIDTFKEYLSKNTTVLND